MVGFGALFAAVGLYFMLVGASLLPIPGGPRNLHAPLWIVACAGLVFFLGGAAVMIQGFGKANARGELPATAPSWMRAAQQAIVLVIFAAFAVLATWVALLGDSRQFSGSFMGLRFSGFDLGAALARTVFGFGALVCWAATIGLAVSAVRKLRAGR
jgi:hypothetical protein